MVLKRFVIILICCCFFSSFAQKEPLQKDKKPQLGLYYGIANEENLLFSDVNYQYISHYLKASINYSISKRRISLELNAQPQIHIIQYQSLERPILQLNGPGYFSDLKNLHLFGLAFEFLASIDLIKNLKAYTFFSIGPAYLDTETKRLPKGFTFMENLGLGIRFKLDQTLMFDIKPSYGHVSNGDFEKPNLGFNTLNIELGMIFNLK